MTYTLPSDVRQIMRKLPSSVTDEDILFHAEKASAYINGLLGKVFTVPFSEVSPPPLIKHIATDLTVFFLSEDLYTSQQPNMDEYQAKRYERVMKLLDEIMEGTLDIGLPMKPNHSSSGFDTTHDGEVIFTVEDPFW